MVASSEAAVHDRLKLADWRHPARCYRLCQSAFEHDEQRAQSLPSATARPRSDCRPRCLRCLARTCCSGGHLDAVRRPRPMGLRGFVRRVRHRVHARFHPSRRLVLVRSASSPTLAYPIAAVSDRQLLFRVVGRLPRAEITSERRRSEGQASDKPQGTKPRAQLEPRPEATSVWRMDRSRAGRRCRSHGAGGAAAGSGPGGRVDEASPWGRLPGATWPSGPRWNSRRATAPPMRFELELATSSGAVGG
jgi:hypothetical protein